MSTQDRTVTRPILLHPTAPDPIAPDPTAATSRNGDAVGFDPAACRDWLGDPATDRPAAVAVAAPLTLCDVAALLIELDLYPAPEVWQLIAPMRAINLWRPPDGDGIECALVTVDIDLDGHRIRLSSRLQDADELTGHPATGIDAAVAALHRIATLATELVTTHTTATATTEPPEPSPTHRSRRARPYTVIGIWDDDTPVPVGVIVGEHPVTGGDEDHFEEGLWATTVHARSDDEAERLAADEMLATHHDTDCEDDDTDDGILVR